MAHDLYWDKFRREGLKKKKKAIILAEAFWEISNISLYPEAAVLKQNLQTIFATSTG